MRTLADRLRWNRFVICSVMVPTESSSDGEDEAVALAGSDEDDDFADVPFSRSGSGSSSGSGHGRSTSKRRSTHAPHGSLSSGPPARTAAASGVAGSAAAASGVAGSGALGVADPTAGKKRPKRPPRLVLPVWLLVKLLVWLLVNYMFGGTFIHSKEATLRIEHHLWETAPV
jgi:hypothetical protein